MGKSLYYHKDIGVVTKKKRPVKRIIGVFLLLVTIFGGGYGYVLSQAPNLKVSAQNADISKLEEDYQNKETDFIKIDKLQLVVSFTQRGPSALTHGAWHRLSEEGDPEKGGTVHLCANRFKLGLTPQATKQNSYFYHLDKLTKDDEIKVFYHAKWYSFVVKRLSDHLPKASATGDTTKLLLYGCNTQGEADGVVVEAETFPKIKETDSKTPIL